MIICELLVTKLDFKSLTVCYILGIITNSTAEPFTCYRHRLKLKAMDQAAVTAGKTRIDQHQHQLVTGHQQDQHTLCCGAGLCLVFFDN